MTVALAIILFLELTQAAPSPAGAIIDDVRKFAAAESNEARFDALTAMLKAHNIPFTVEPFTIPEPGRREPRTEGRNVVVTLGGGTEQIVVGAHYDAARLADGTLSRGAVDNAASSVMLVRLAESLGRETLRKRVKIVWFDMEELGLLGSHRYVQMHKDERTVAMLNFDINAYGDTILFGPSEPAEGAALRKVLAETCAAELRDCIAFPEMPPGDDRSFVSAQVPALSIAVLPAVEAHQVWLLMNGGQNSGLPPGQAPAILRTIHTLEDTAAKVDGESTLKMLRFAQALVRAVIRL